MNTTKPKGFTLIELLVVVAIIGILATVVLASLGSAREKARDARRLSDMKTIQTALEVFFIDNGYYPRDGWYYSNANSWNSLKTQLGVTLPADPINESGLAHQGVHTYGYYASTNTTYCNGKAYMLVINLEGKEDNSPGVTFCNNVHGYNGAVVVGVDGSGNYVGPGI